MRQFLQDRQSKRVNFFGQTQRWALKQAAYHEMKRHGYGSRVSSSEIALLLRVFTKIGVHHTVKDFAPRGKEPKHEVHIYTWQDTTLRELTDLLGEVQMKEVAPAARKQDAHLSFAFVYPDRLEIFWMWQLLTSAVSY
jgi:hypothetical protein